MSSRITLNKFRIGHQRSEEPHRGVEASQYAKTAYISIIGTPNALAYKVVSPLPVTLHIRFGRICLAGEVGIPGATLVPLLTGI
jgi:hypothetical protein